METVGELFAEDDVEKVIDELSKAVKDAIQTKNAIQTKKFKGRFEDLDSTLEKLKPLIKFMVTGKKKQKDIPKHKKVLDQSNDEVEMVKQIENGKELVVNYSNWFWNGFNNDKELRNLEKSLNWFLRILNMEKVRIGIKDLIVSRKNKEKVVIQNIEEFPDLAWVPKPEFTVGLDEPLRYLKETLLKDHAPMLVVTGPGGHGKSTLAIKFCQVEEVKDKFKENIFFVTLSKEPYFDIVQQLYQLMKSQEAGQDPLLLVLDDVCSKSESLLQKFNGLNMQNYKILVTSRSEFSDFGTPYYLKPLNDEDSLRLLRHSASLGDSSSVPEDLLKEVLKHFNGVPLAITVIGKSFSGKPEEFWRSKLANRREGSSLDYETKLLLNLKSSMDALGDNEAITRECFMDLASFPEDQRISAAAFIDMWAGLYGLEDFRSIMILHDLYSKGLANLVSTRKENIDIQDDYYSEHFVSQHNMLRNQASRDANLEPIEKRKRLNVVSGHNEPQWLKERKSQPFNARLLSISSDGMFSTQWKTVHLSQVEVLVLNFKTEKNALPNFVQKIHELKVLIVTNYGSSTTDLSDFHLLKSLPSLMRIRLERISIRSITKNFVTLKSLKKISLFMCDQIYLSCSLKISDAWPGLEEMNIDYCHDLKELPVELCDLVRMKMLSITNCHNLSALPEEMGKLENLEVLRLRSCVDLESLPVSIEKLTKLRGLDLYNCIKIMELPEGIGNMSCLRKINMGLCSGLEDLPQSVCNLNLLEEVICDEAHKLLWESYLAGDKIKVAKEKHDLRWLENPPS